MARLLQLDYRDKSKNLIAPWDTYEKLRPGTVVLIDAVVNCWKIGLGGKGDKYRKVSNIIEDLNSEHIVINY